MFWLCPSSQPASLCWENRRGTVKLSLNIKRGRKTKGRHHQRGWWTPTVWMWLEGCCDRSRWSENTPLQATGRIQTRARKHAHTQIISYFRLTERPTLSLGASVRQVTPIPFDVRARSRSPAPEWGPFVVWQVQLRCAVLSPAGPSLSNRQTRWCMGKGKRPLGHGVVEHKSKV